MSNYLTYKGYIATIEFSAEDDVFYGKIHGINDLVSFEAESVKEIKEAFKDAVDDYLVTCQQLNKTPDKTYKGTFNVRLSRELHRKAAIVAGKKSISLNDFVKKAISYAVNHENEIDGQVL